MESKVVLSPFLNLKKGGLKREINYGRESVNCVYGNDFEGYYGDDSIYIIKCRRLYFTVWNIINQFS
ncbi:hypothetical protein [Flavobacterium sp.]|uniref:hypothetical protein n=1 Tax=Flavobacterium sp. TaxID=239 RepID=UPI003A94BA4B